MTGDVAVEEAGGAPTGQRPVPDDPLLRSLIEPFDDAQWSISHGQDVVRLPCEDLIAFATAARDAGFEMLADVTAVDWFGVRTPRFEVVSNLLSMQHLRRLRVIVEVPAHDPRVPSLFSIWPGADFPEREVFDMFGIVFDGHPDLTRILMPDDWEGHPLRKDFAWSEVPVQFKGSHKVI